MNRSLWCCHVLCHSSTCTCWQVGWVAVPYGVGALTFYLFPYLMNWSLWCCHVLRYSSTCTCWFKLCIPHGLAFLTCYQSTCDHLDSILGSLTLRSGALTTVLARQLWWSLKKLDYLLFYKSLLYININRDIYKCKLIYVSVVIYSIYIYIYDSNAFLFVPTIYYISANPVSSHNFIKTILRTYSCSRYKFLMAIFV